MRRWQASGVALCGAWFTFLCVSTAAAASSGPKAAESSTATRPLEADAIVIARLEAVPKASRSTEQWLSLARAYVRSNLLVEATEAYEQLSARGESSAIATEHMQVQQRLPQVSVRVLGGGDARTRLFVDAEPVAPNRASYSVNPGWHTFLLEVDGHARAAQRLFAEEGGRHILELHAAPESALLTSQAGSDAPLPRQTTSVEDHRGDSWVPVYASLGVATAASIAAGLFTRRMRNRNDESRSLCTTPLPNGGGQLCGSASERDELSRLQDEAASARSGAVVSGLIAVVGVGSAVTFWALHDDGKSSAQLAVDATGLTLRGRF